MKFDGMIREKVNIAVQKIKRDVEEGPTDILKWFTFMATDITGVLSFGRSFNALETEKVIIDELLAKNSANDRQKTQYIKDLDVVIMISGLKTELEPLFSLLSILPLPPPLGREAPKIHNRFCQYGLTAIKGYTKQIQDDNDTGSNCLFSKVIRNDDMSEELMAVEAGNFIVAGTETTSNTLTYLIYTLLLPQNENIKEKLMKEIADVPTDAGSQQLLSLAYLKGAIMETLRIYGGAPGSLPRICPSGMNLSSYYIPAGTTISTQFYSLHYDPSVFPEPEK